MTFVYPKLPAAYTTPFFRIGGNGLANCLFVYAKAIITSKERNVKMIAPTWFNLTIGPHIRREKDKRHYVGLFNSKGEISGIKKLFYLILSKIPFFRVSIIVEEGIYDYFKPLIGYHTLVGEYISQHANQEILSQVNKFDFSNCIAVHIRLGDYIEEWRVPMSWYKEKIQIYGNRKRVLVFSDGKESELSEVLCLPNVERAFFGNAIADMIAMSKCEYLIGSDSSFSAWSAYLGQVPGCFYRLRFGYVLQDAQQQIIEHK